jgi:hypothetical protein
MASLPPFTTREEWLRAAEVIMAAWVRADNDGHYPEKTRVSCGFPKVSRGRGDAIGQCWDTSVSADGTFEMFISPVIGDPSRVCDILLHEMVHAAVGLEHGHNKVFGKLARRLGLEGKLTAPVAGDELKELIKSQIVDKLGPYPHAKLGGEGGGKTTPKQKTYLIKLACPECEYPAYTTRKWLDSDGAPVCPSCNIPLAE